MGKYYPEQPVSPITLEQIVEYLFRELNRVDSALRQDGFVNFEVEHVARGRPQDGDVAYADGVDWNPGQGVGLYVFLTNAWFKLNHADTDDATFDDLTADTLRLTSTTELTLASTAHAFQIGLSNTANLAADANEIQARNNGAAAQLDLNPHGGTVTTGAGLTVTGALGAGATTVTTLTASGLFTLSNGQIEFPAVANPSANANTLDDWERGTFTPTISFGGGSTGVTYGTQAGHYLKKGDEVGFWIQLALTSNGTSTGTALLDGLPFTSAGAINYACAVQPIGGFSGLVAGVSANVTAGATTINLRGPNTTGSAALNETNVLDTASLYVAGGYLT